MIYVKEFQASTGGVIQQAIIDMLTEHGCAVDSSLKVTAWEGHERWVGKTIRWSWNNGGMISCAIAICDDPDKEFIFFTWNTTNRSVGTSSNGPIFALNCFSDDGLYIGTDAKSHFQFYPMVGYLIAKDEITMRRLPFSYSSEGTDLIVEITNTNLYCSNAMMTTGSIYQDENGNKFKALCQCYAGKLAY